MAVSWAWQGSVTDASVRVRAKVGGTSARLAVSEDEGMSSPTFFGPESPTAEGVVTLDATGLDPDRRYHWQVEDDGTLDPGSAGQMVTDPVAGEPASFTVGAAGDAGHGPPRFPGVGDVLAPERMSNHPVFDLLAQRAVSEGWRRFLHLGDLHYLDLGSGNHGITGGGSLANCRRAYDDVLAQPRQHGLYRSVPGVYPWDDHDWVGGNNSDGTAVDRDNLLQAYREVVPHYPLAMGDDPALDDHPIHHSFGIGRVLFVVSDVRADRSPNDDTDGPDKTMLGASQRAWMEGLLDGHPAELLVWVTPAQWMGTSQDSWGGFQHERGEMVEMLGDLGWLGRMIAVNADQHSLGIDTGTLAPGGIPTFQFASMDAGFNAPSHHMDSGPNSPGKNRYGTLAFADDGDAVEVTGTGWIGRWAWRSHTVRVEVDGAARHVSSGSQTVSARLSLAGS